MSRIIRKSKVQGQRMGQLIANALYHDNHGWRDGVNLADFHTKLFYIENDELERLVQNFLADASWTRAAPNNLTKESKAKNVE